MAILFGLSFLRESPETPAQVQSLAGVVFMTMAFMGVVHSTTPIGLVVSERASYYRERAANMYGVTPYVLSFTLAEIPYLILNTLLFISVFYFFPNYDNNVATFFKYWVVYFLYISVATFLGQFFAVALPTAAIANLAAMGFTAMCALFAGFLIAVRDIPTFWTFMTYITPMRYAFSALIIVTLECGCSVAAPFNDASNCCPAGDFALAFCNVTTPCSNICDSDRPGCTIFNVSPPGQPAQFFTAWDFARFQWGFDADTLGRDIGAVVGFIIGFRVLTILALKFVNHLKR